ncbi:putative nuclease HARBI1 isoform X2 [Monomorium pharaonis]|nr:putative nuclease HARBI1 isoform X2 [Monomorium pharaonis]
MRRVTYALHQLAPRFINWPQGRRATEVMIAFERMSGFPGVIGAIDGTHVEIRSPQDDQHQAYINRKGYQSICRLCVSKISYSQAFLLVTLDQCMTLECLESRQWLVLRASRNLLSK